jgi:acyl-CoA synthetase (AMP-forming)/AMP-acid ligase II
MLSHHMILNNAYQTTLAQEYDKHETRICLPLPLYHCFGMVLGSLATITTGLTCVLPSPVFNSEDALKAIQNEKCTTLYGTPTMFIDMYSHPNFHKYEMSSLNAGFFSFFQVEN